MVISCGYWVSMALRDDDAGQVGAEADVEVVVAGHALGADMGERADDDVAQRLLGPGVVGQQAVGARRCGAGVVVFHGGCLPRGGRDGNGAGGVAGCGVWADVDGVAVPIPTYDELMLPVLRLCAEKTWVMRDLIARVSDDLALGEEERQELLPSGGISVIGSRVHWAKTYMKQAGLLEQPRRAHVQITPAGRAVLASAPQKDRWRSSPDLSWFPGFPETDEGPGRQRAKKHVACGPGCQHSVLSRADEHAGGDDRDGFAHAGRDGARRTTGAYPGRHAGILRKADRRPAAENGLRRFEVRRG